jgi:hypothetical protein
MNEKAHYDSQAHHERHADDDEKCYERVFPVFIVSHTELLTAAYKKTSLLF